MRFSRDRRGQSVVVGTVILFGFLILALSLYQVQIVPQENTQVEFDHSQQVEGEFLDVRNAVLSASRTGTGRSTSVKLGTRYPQRTFALNPPPAFGRLSTSAPRELRVENATVEGGSNVVDYWQNRTNMDGAIAFDTRSLRYSPEYNELRDSPDLVYENSFVVAEFDNTALGRSGQTVVDSDNRIRLIALNGNIDESDTRRTSVDPDALSQSRRSVRLTSAGGDPIVLELPTDVSPDRSGDLEQVWSDRLGTDVEEVTVSGGTVRIELDGAEAYRLSLGAVGVGDGTSAPNESDGYITKISSNNGVAVAEVRDRYNNPVEDAQVNISVDGAFEETTRTDGEGRVSYEVTDVSDVEMEINAGTETWESVLFENVGVGAGGGDRTESLLVAPDEAVAFNGPGSAEQGGFQLDVENQHDGAIRITDVTVLPDDPNLNGLSDEAAGSGPGRSELYVESAGGVVGEKNVLLGLDQEYTFVPNSGLRLNLQRGPEKRAYDIGAEAYVDAETEFAGAEVPLGSNERATITLAEFYEVGQNTANVVNVVDETFSVTVGYKIDGERRTEQFVTTVTQGPVGQVDLQDNIEDSDGSFEVTTDQYQNLAEGWVVVENIDTGQTESFESSDGQTTTVDSADAGGVAAGDEIVATLYESDAEQNELDTDSTVVGGEPFGVFVQGEESLGNGGDIDADFEVNSGSEVFSFDVNVDRSGNSANYGGTVTIDGGAFNNEELTLTGAAAEDLGTGNEIDLLNPDIYDSVNEGGLQSISEQLDSGSTVESLNNGGSVDLGQPDVREQ
ncbi:hypothetical protein SAMN04488067_102126 [Halorubrum xinjiangense]|uniref:Uncharacterized protein n=1 Tax=Halorubrum xinjiangense TaxID=261291 RepID=A0A1G7IP87_9EURY|nr:Ig-like domain-containing protein [Halorubrum xinjiangense]SDF14572.1 hypothetical protein SAMN04488067_102126 [Halorubrum xinjiangense]